MPLHGFLYEFFVKDSDSFREAGFLALVLQVKLSYLNMLTKSSDDIVFKQYK